MRNQITEVLELLSSDARYAERVKELRAETAALKAQEAKLSEVRQIAATIDRAKEIERQADAVLIEAELKKKEVDEYLRQRKNELEDGNRALELSLNERLGRELDQYRCAGEMLAEAKSAKQKAEAIWAEVKERGASLDRYEQTILKREMLLQQKFAKLSQFMSGLSEEK